MPIYNSVGGITGLTIENDPSALKLANNLSDLPNLATARTNLQLSTYFAALGHNHTGTYAPLASPTFTGVVTIPAGASISGYLTTATASSTYQTLSGMTSYLTTSTASSTYQTQAGMSSYLTTSTASSTYQPIGSYLTDAPSDGSEYVRKNAAWAIVTGGGGGSVAWGSVTGTLTSQTDLNTALGLKADLASPTFSGQVYVPDIRNILNTDLVIDSYNDTGAGTHYLHKFTPNDGKFVLAPNGGGLTFPDLTVQTTAFVAKTVSSVSSGGHTFVAADANSIRYVPNDIYYSTITVSVPEDSVHNFAVGTMIDLCFSVDSTSSISISTTSAGSPSLLGNTGSISGGQTGRRTFIKLAANFWLIS